MKKFYFLFTFLVTTIIANAQFAPESDPHRGFYLDHFLRFWPGTSDVDTSRSILGVDKDFDGIFEKEDAVLRYACENHITYLALYDMHRTIGTTKTIWNENTHQFENPEKHLCRFIEKARSQYGITQIGSVGGSANFFDSLGTFLDRYPVTAPIHLSNDIKNSTYYNARLASVESNSYATKEDQQAAEYLKLCMRVLNFNSTNACQADIDVLNVEYEFWGDCNGTFSDFLAIAQSMKALQTTYNSAHPLNPIKTEAYLAFLSYCGGNQTAVTQTIDGCKNCSPCSSCSNPHEALIDRVLYSILQSNPYSFPFGDQNYFELSSTQDSTDFHPMLYSESMNFGGGFDFLGQWFTQAPTNTIFFSEEYYFYHWLNSSGSALGTPRQNDVQAGGVHWFSQSYMVGHLDHPRVIQTPGPFCSNGDSTLISLDYYGPDEPGTDYTFNIIRDSDSAVVYPRTGNMFTGTSMSTIPSPAYRSINFRDTLQFPKCYLPDGSYTATINLNYNHSTGCSYSSSAKISISSQPKIELVGDSVFCEGNRTFLNAPIGGFYVWYRNGKVIPGASNAVYSAGDDGDYQCMITGTTCSGLSNTIHLTVHPNPTASLNITCNGNNTYTLKTDLEAANSNSTDLTGPYGVTYLWSTGETTDQITVPYPTSTDRVYVTITDRYTGCTRLRHAALLATPNTSIVPSITVNTVPSTPCSSNGSLTAIAGNVLGTISYFWSNGATTQTINYLPPGNYTVTMTLYANPCSAQSTVTLGTMPTTGPTIVPTIVQTTCNNKNDGSISLAISGGNPPFTFDWVDIPNENGYNSHSQNLTALYSGSYTLNLTDNNGCKFTYTYDVNYLHTAPSASFSTTPVTTCGTNTNGSATLTATGNGPFQYLWNDINHQTTTTATNLPAGTISVSVTDINSCFTNFNVSVPSQQINLQATLIDSSNLSTSCQGNSDGTIFLNIDGGIEPYTANSPWQIDSNFVHLENLGDTTISLLVSDANGCQLSNTFTITSPTFSISSFPTPSTCIGCPNGNILINHLGGIPPFTYQWTPTNGMLSGDTIIDLTSGTYVICVTDSNNCTVCVTDTVKEEPTKINQIQEENSFEVFPNPSSGNITISTNQLLDKTFHLRIADLQGRIVFEKQDLLGTIITFNLQLSNAIYIVELFDGNHEFARKRITILN